MKKLLCVALLTASPVVLSDESICDDSYKLAHVIMSLRQHGLAMEAVLNTGKEGVLANSPEYEVLETIVTAAYMLPIQYSDSEKFNSQEVFATLVRRQCVQAISTK